MAAPGTYDNGLIVALGEALWGETTWQAQMSRAIGVHKDTVQDWRQGKSRPRPSIYAELAPLLDERADRIAVLRPRLVAMIADGASGEADG